MRVPPSADRDFTASAFVVEEGRVLLIQHAKLERWLQPGGHVEPRETPDEAAIREVQEETGVRMEIHEDYHSASADPASDALPEPFHVNLHEVREDHWHCDFAFLGVMSERGEATDGGAHTGLRWVSRGALSGLTPIDSHTRRMAERAIGES